MTNDLPVELTGDEISDMDLEDGYVANIGKDEDDNTMTCADMAAELGMTGRALRRRFRSLGLGCGQGSFYLITRDELESVRTKLGI